MTMNIQNTSIRNRHANERSAQVGEPARPTLRRLAFLVGRHRVLALLGFGSGRGLLLHDLFLLLVASLRLRGFVTHGGLRKMAWCR